MLEQKIKAPLSHYQSLFLTQTISHYKPKIFMFPSSLFPISISIYKVKGGIKDGRKNSAFKPASLSIRTRNKRGWKTRFKDKILYEHSAWKFCRCTHYSK